MLLSSDTKYAKENIKEELQMQYAWKLKLIITTIAIWTCMDSQFKFKTEAIEHTQLVTFSGGLSYFQCCN